MIESGLKWVRDGLGITKGEKKAKMDEIAAKEGATWSDKHKRWEKGGEAVDIPRLTRAQEGYEKAPPSFLEGVPEAIKSALASWSPEVEVPGLPALAEALTNLQAAIEKWLPEDETTAVGVPPDIESEMNAAGYYRSERGWVGPNDENLGPEGHKKASEYLRSLQERKLEGMATGGQIRSTGPLIGHGGEEFDNPATVSAGKTTLDRINEIFSGGNAYSGGQSISISAPVSVSVHVDKLSSDADIERLASKIGSEGADKLLFALRNKLDNLGTRGIGYLRG